MKGIIFGIPIVQLLVFGYAVTTDVKNIATAFCDLDKSYQSREVARRLEASGYFTIKYAFDEPGRLRELLDRGEVLCAIQINRGFAKDLKKGVPTQVQVIVDGTDSNTGTIALDYVTRVITRYAKDLGAGKVSVRLAQIDLRARAWYNPNLESRNYNVPGVIAIMVMLICLLLTSMAVVREREIGTMEQLMVTPLKPVELMLGKTIPFAAIGFFDMFLVTAVGVAWFRIPIAGSLGLLVLSTGIYLLSGLGIGLFISTIVRTQQQAMLATFLFFMPAVLLSGFMFPIENMPKIIQYGTYANPLRYFLVIIRGIFLKGNGAEILWRDMGSLFIIGAAVMTMSSLRFRKRLG